MRLYTVCIHDKPVVTLSADADLPMEDSFIHDPAFMKAHRGSQAMMDKMRAVVPDLDKIRELREIDDTLDTWLGADLQSFESNGAPLWTGDPTNIQVREASADEAEEWRSSRQRAIDTEEIEAGDEEWVAFLVPVSDPTDDE